MGPIARRPTPRPRPLRAHRGDAQPTFGWLRVGKGMWNTNGGYEYNVVVTLAGAFALAGVGPEDWSLDDELGIEASANAPVYAPSRAASQDVRKRGNSPGLRPRRGA